jgi:hypothetical protein
MKSFEYDLRYLKAGADELENYLLSDDIFWPVDIRPPAGQPGYPQLTLGGLLLARKRLIAYDKSPKEAEDVEKLITNMDAVRSNWRVAWERKAGRSFGVRLKMWRDFIEEYRQGPLDNADRYPYEVRLRTMLALLKTEGGGQASAEADLLAILDKFLDTVLITDGFVWEPELQMGFPENIYWYLYGRLPAMPMDE